MSPKKDQLSLRSSIARDAEHYPEQPKMLLPWGGENRRVAEIERNGRIQGHKEMTKHKLEMFKAQLRQIAELELFDDIDETMDEAERRAAINPHRAMAYMETAEAFIRFKLKAHQITHYPLEPTIQVRYI